MAKRVRSVRRFLINSFLTVGSVGLLLAVLVAFDGQVRDEVSAMMNGRAASGVTATTGRARKFVSVVTSSVKQQSSEHRPLMIMLMAGTVLGLVMFRM